MKRKFHLIIALVLALTIGGGVYAYTYTTASAPIEATGVEGDIATVETVVNQPTWDIVLEELQQEKLQLEQMESQLQQLESQLGDPELDDEQRQALQQQIRALQLQIQELQQHLLIGEAPAGDLFQVKVHPAYTGKLLVKVYLTNAGALTLAYEQLDMELSLAGSVDGVQLLTLDNGVTIFNLEGGVGESHLVELIGGSYRLISVDPPEDCITPEFYCEVTQR